MRKKDADVGGEEVLTVSFNTTIVWVGQLTLNLFKSPIMTWSNTVLRSTSR